MDICGLPYTSLLVLHFELSFFVPKRTNLDPIQLSLFSNRFMSIAEQMGKTLQRTSISTNIKERLDFSCALFGVRIIGVLPTHNYHNRRR